MTAIYQGVVKIVGALRRTERLKLMEELLQDPALREDLEDALLIMSRKNERGEPLEKFAARMRRKGRLK